MPTTMWINSHWKIHWTIIFWECSWELIKWAVNFKKKKFQIYRAWTGLQILTRHDYLIYQNQESNSKFTWRIFLLIKFYTFSCAVVRMRNPKKWKNDQLEIQEIFISIPFTDYSCTAWNSTVELLSWHRYRIIFIPFLVYFQSIHRNMRF